MSNFEILVNGKIFTNWKTAKLSRTIDENTGKFQFSSSNIVPANFPVRAGDAVQIVVEGEPRLTGFCDVVESSVENGTDTITVSGRDNTSDLIDSSMPDSVKNIEGPLSMVGLVTKVISALGAVIGVIDTTQGVSDFGELDFFGADAGKNCMIFLTDFARKRQVYLITDGRGNLNIFRPGALIVTGVLQNKRNNPDNNVVSSSVRFNHSQRFGKYSSRSQDNFGADPTADIDFGIDRKGESIDNQIRSSRFLEVQAEESMTEIETVDRSVEEMNIRRARSIEYRASVAGVERVPGLLWDIGQLTKVDDEFSGIKGIFLTRSIEFAVDRSTGTRTAITLAPPEAYNVKISDQADTRRAKQGTELQTQAPPVTGNRFIR